MEKAGFVERRSDPAATAEFDVSNRKLQRASTRGAIAGAERMRRLEEMLPPSAMLLGIDARRWCWTVRWVRCG
jgi:hypothetical protein